VVEIAVAPVAEAVARHVDRRAKAAAVEEIGELRALGGLEHRSGYREAAGVELGAQVVPVERADALGKR